MRPLPEMDTVQIEITNACINQCSNCTRLVGHHQKPYFMDFETFKTAIDSLEEYAKTPGTHIVGMMGGEPLLHPDFERFCEYMREKIPFGSCGLWTCFPRGKEHYRKAISQTFGNVLLNDHSKDDVLHGPVLVASEELEIDEWYKEYMIEKCWVQNTWSACVNPNGAFFCEVAGALSLLLDKEGESLGWKPEPGWWKKTPKHFVAQMERYCRKCGVAMPLERRPSTDGRDDISPKMLNVLRETSPKIKRGAFVEAQTDAFNNDTRPVATYKDPHYRDKIAARYGMFLMLNNRGYQTAFCTKEWPQDA